MLASCHIFLFWCFLCVCASLLLLPLANVWQIRSKRVVCWKPIVFLTKTQSPRQTGNLSLATVGTLWGGSAGFLLFWHTLGRGCFRLDVLCLRFASLPPSPPSFLIPLTSSSFLFPICFDQRFVFFWDCVVKILKTLLTTRHEKLFRCTFFSPTILCVLVVDKQTTFPVSKKNVDEQTTWTIACHRIHQSLVGHNVSYSKPTCDQKNPVQ